jgi:hypothetical protein
MATLRAKKPEPQEDRLKLLLFSDAGIGKTTAAVQMPRTYYIDTERGANKKFYTEAIVKNNGVYFGVEDGAGDPDEVLKEVESLSKVRHEYRTLVLDSFTTLFEAKAEEGAQKVGTDFGKHTDYANRWAKKLFRVLTLLDMNIVITSHAKDTWEKGERGEQTADGFKKQRYLFDLVLKLERRPNGKRFALVDKTRYAEFPDRDSFEWSYAELERRWGATRLEREAAPVARATPEQVAELVKKVEALSISTEVTDKWLKAVDCEKFEDFTSEQADKCIKYCDDKIKAATAAKKEDK